MGQDGELPFLHKKFIEKVGFSPNPLTTNGQAAQISLKLKFSKKDILEIIRKDPAFQVYR
jgi:hypothetical protein